ncbi:hypothetical protein [Gloeothece verrucosa]|uniref:Uncharacterized protein n=1 Tax=Gloeothece verrucosa (strain PCC 7822) TaxID=497965 RepID=E0U525_GLOV7|nr:hypothetical protein [Gloeothece verrucosa]ADN12304.1 hypothetical protein Cyan7822_0256 [Gloeothece verrucosa PCC 7822]
MNLADCSQQVQDKIIVLKDQILRVKPSGYQEELSRIIIKK